MLGQLGCGDYAARIVSRGATSVVWEEIPFTDLSWGRVLDDTSQATVNVDGLVRGCPPQVLFAGTRTMQHEVAIYRAGSLVWCGPLTDRKAKGTHAEMDARDRSFWWDDRFLHADHAFTNIDLATIFKAYFDDAMGVDPISGFTCVPTLTGIGGTRSVAALDHKPAGPEMREVSAIGVDWTCVGFTCIAGGRTIPTGRLPVITDDHLVDDPDVEDNGVLKANRIVTTGGQPVDASTGQAIDGPAIFGEASDASLQALDGLIEQNVQDDNALDVPSATAASASNLALIGNGGVIVSSLILGPNAPMTIDQLVPGALIDIELSRPAIPVSGIFRISNVDVVVSASQGEQVTITVQPIGST